MYINIAVQYVRPKQISYVRDTFSALINGVIAQENLDLETDPVRVSPQSARGAIVLD